ncbi:MAG: hypothetical protein C0405_13035 [Desulfovibrio sp.]|nr:hypothetical protein [Desulfovibrio sp.]
MQRQQELVRRGAAAQAALDKALLARDLARQTLQRAQARMSLVKEGFRREDIAAAAADLEYARATLALARTRLSYATLTAPTGGVVLVRDSEPGQVAAVGAPIITLGDLNGVWLEVYLPETDLPKVRLGQEARVFTDAWPGQAFPGRVTYVASKAEFTPKTVQTPKERVTLVFRTKVRVDNPEHRLRPGMPGEAIVTLAPPPAEGNGR